MYAEKKDNENVLISSIEFKSSSTKAWLIVFYIKLKLCIILYIIKNEYVCIFLCMNTHIIEFI